MERRSLRVVPVAGVLLLAAACGGVQEDAEEAVGEAPATFVYENALNANALNANALNANALGPSALAEGALDPARLGPDVLARLRDPGPAGYLSRQLLAYTVSCALGPSQSFSLSWADGKGLPEEATYPGLLGLAPTWATRAPTLAQRGWVSACLASRVNWYGVPVTLSSRGRTRLLDAATAEQKAYPALEGAFWGDVFGATPYLRACHDPSGEANARAHLRDCAAGHLTASGDVVDCGIVHIVGACADVCAEAGPGTTYYAGCSVDAADAITWTDRVVTTYLP